MSAVLRWTDATEARSQLHMTCTVTSRRFRRIWRRVVYSFLSPCAASRTFISCSKFQPPLRAGDVLLSGGAGLLGSALAATASATAARRSCSGLSAGAEPLPEPTALPRSRTSSSASPALAELSTADATPSRLSAGRSTQPVPASAGPAKAGRSNPRCTETRMVIRSEAASASSARRQAPSAAGAAKSLGRRYPRRSANCSAPSLLLGALLHSPSRSFSPPSSARISAPMRRSSGQKTASLAR
mmetsp:Transcript_24371/g.66476  ORF Transcript_24371/g.66476 Transcript_24371/m.66476 type:complete len:243 (+) Transcript_24371:695-1423(+)